MFANSRAPRVIAVRARELSKTRREGDALSSLRFWLEGEEKKRARRLSGPLDGGGTRRRAQLTGTFLIWTIDHLLQVADDVQTFVAALKRTEPAVAGVGGGATY